jgi:hypothetical protein
MPARRIRGGLVHGSSDSRTLGLAAGLLAAGAALAAQSPAVLSQAHAMLREGRAVGLVVGLNDSSDAAEFTITRSTNLVTVTSPRAPRCQAGLARAVPARTFSGTPFEILFGIATTFDESLRTLPTPGMVQGGGAGLTNASRESLRRPVTIGVEAGTLQQALDRLIASVPGLGWLASERCDASGACGCYLSLMTESSVVSTSYDAAAGLQMR